MSAEKHELNEAKMFVLYFELANPRAARPNWGCIFASPRLKLDHVKGNSWVVDAEQEVIDALLVLFPYLRATEQKTYRTVV